MTDNTTKQTIKLNISKKSFDNVLKIDGLKKKNNFNYMLVKGVYDTSLAKQNSIDQQFKTCIDELGVKNKKDINLLCVVYSVFKNRESLINCMTYKDEAQNQLGIQNFKILEIDRKYFYSMYSETEQGWINKNNTEILIDTYNINYLWFMKLKKFRTTDYGRIVVETDEGVVSIALPIVEPGLLWIIHSNENLEAKDIKYLENKKYNLLYVINKKFI